MTMITRRDFYGRVQLDNRTIESDYLDTDLTNMNLTTVRNWRIPHAFAHRPDLISNKFFGNFHMGWLICLHNDLIDPFNDLYVGRLIKIPDLDEYYRFYNVNARG